MLSKKSYFVRPCTFRKIQFSDIFFKHSKLSQVSPIYSQNTGNYGKEKSFTRSTRGLLEQACSTQQSTRQIFQAPRAGSHIHMGNSS